MARPKPPPKPSARWPTRTATAASPHKNTAPRAPRFWRKASELIRNQPITHARLVHDQLRLRRRVLELLAKGADGNAKIFGLADVRGSPGGAQQRVVGENAAWTLGELRQQGPFLGGQVDVVPTAA